MQDGVAFFSTRGSSASWLSDADALQFPWVGALLPTVFSEVAHPRHTLSENRTEPAPVGAALRFAGVVDPRTRWAKAAKRQPDELGCWLPVTPVPAAAGDWLEQRRTVAASPATVWPPRGPVRPANDPGTDRRSFPVEPRRWSRAPVASDTKDQRTPRW